MAAHCTGIWLRDEGQAGYGVTKGNLDKLYHGIDYQGRICGVDGPNGVPGKPYLFWCMNSAMAGASLSLNLKDPICVENCPGTEAVGGLFAPATECKQVSAAEQINSYKTMVVMNRYCFPVRCAAICRFGKDEETATKVVEDSTLQGLTEPIPIAESAPENTGPDHKEEKALVVKTVKEQEEAQQPTRTPGKRPSPSSSSDDVTPEKHAKVQFGKQVHAKVELCKVCSCPRDESFKGGCCHNCLKVCRKMFGHQRIEDILSKEDAKAKVATQSKELQPYTPPPPSPKCQCNCGEMAGLVKQMANLVSRMEKLEAKRGKQ
eukprot:Skav227365  [mRNA]  locus=scaffold2373:32154:42948:+ [translate_table: standard]